MSLGSKILIFFAVGLQIRQNITLVALRQRYAATRPNQRNIQQKANRHGMIVEK